MSSNSKDFEYIEDGKNFAYDKDGNKISLGDTINNSEKKIVVTYGILDALQPFFINSKFSIKYNYLSKLNN